MLSGNEIRQQFLDFFTEKGHRIVPSAPIVVKNDPTLLFTNAGMNQFKDYFLGNRPPEASRIADTQKCLRVSGKHNDLEEVGVDTYHHTMFEMLGNWSFGDYFKEDAIKWCWELLVEVYQIPKDKLYVTVFQGDAKENLEMDTEAYNFWKQYIAKDRILMGNKKDNFWEMGDTGPCGPCSEVHVDCRPEHERAAIDGKTLVNADHPQVIEIWNNVFMQFNRLKDGTLEPLPAKHVDTGMGLERLVRVLQGKQSNYDTDLFTGTIGIIAQITGKTYGYTDSKPDVAFRVLADHIRAIGFTIADGQLPSNTGAGYVIRRILRRAVRYYYSYLDYNHPLLHQLMPALAKQFETVFPALFQQLDLVKNVVKEEEDAFLRTLEKGLKKMDDIIQSTQQQATTTIDGKAAFELYDTYGFPMDLTRLIGQENGLDVDEAAFTSEMQQQKTRSRAATALDTDDWVILKEIGQQNFVGYTTLEANAQVVKYRRVAAKGVEHYQLVLDTTPFYAESGGQVGDRGELIFPNDTLAIVDTKKEDGLTIHFTQKLPENIAAPLIARVSAELRQSTTLHHSATHLLHAALRQVLGTHVAQKGSLVNEDNLRFDFSHFAKISPEEMLAIEQLVNRKIRENIPVVIKEMGKDEAIALGAMALFGEKYGDKVRVVIMDAQYSIELCGGTHIGSTGELGLFKLTSEGAVAAGIRRIEAVTGAAAEAYVHHKLQTLDAIHAKLKQPKDTLKAIEKLQEDKALLEKQIEALELKQLAVLRNELLTKTVAIQSANFLGQIVSVSSADNLKKLCNDLKSHIDNHLIVLCCVIDNKPFVAIGVADALVADKGLDANKIIKDVVAGKIKGGGGGQKTLATAGGQDINGLESVIAAVQQLLS